MNIDLELFFPLLLTVLKGIYNFNLISSLQYPVLIMKSMVTIQKKKIFKQTSKHQYKSVNDSDCMLFPLPNQPTELSLKSSKWGYGGKASSCSRWHPNKAFPQKPNKLNKYTPNSVGRRKGTTMCLLNSKFNFFSISRFSDSKSFSANETLQN